MRALAQHSSTTDSVPNEKPMIQTDRHTRTRPGYLADIDRWWERRSRDDGAPFLALLGPSGSGKLDTTRGWEWRNVEAGVVSYADGGFLTSGYFAGLEPIVMRAISEAEAKAPELVQRSEQSLKRLFPHISSTAYRVPPDLTNSSSKDERTRFYHHEYQHKLLNGLYEFLVSYFAAFERRSVVVIDNAHALSATVRSFIRLVARRRGLERYLSLVLLIDGHHIDPALATACDAVRFEPLDLSQAAQLVSTWESADDVTTKQLEERWLAAEGNPAMLAALFECARSGVDAADRLTSDALLDFYLTVRGERFRRDLLEAYVEGHCIDDDPISVRNHHSYDSRAKATLHAAAIARGGAACKPPRFIHHVSLGTVAEQLEALSDGALVLQEIGLYDTWFSLLSPYYGSGRLRVLPDGEQPHNLAFLRMAFVLYSLGLSRLAVPYLDLFYSAFPDSRLTPTALYAQSMAHGRYQVPVDLNTAERYAVLNLEKIDTIFRDHPKHTYIKVFAENALAYIRARQGRFDEALDLCRSGIEQMRQVYGDQRYRLHQSILVYNTGQVHEILGDFENAYEKYTEAIGMDPYYGEYHNDLANLLRRHGRLDEALDHYQRAIDLCPPYYEAHFNRASVHAELGDLESAEADYLRTIELQPTEAGAYLGLGALALEAGDHERARELLDQAIHHAPRNADAYNNRALAHRGREDAAAALADLDAAIGLRPRFAEAYNNRAAVHFELQDSEASLRDLDQAVALDDAPDYRRNRAFLYEALGRHAEAEADLAAAGG
jgi:tetratricopeptide (TPR) repeat protein